MNIRRPYVVVLSLLALAAPAGAQQLTVERIFSTEFRPAGVGVQWTGAGSDFEVVEEGAGGSTELWSDVLGGGKRTRLAVPDSAKPVGIEEYQWSGDRSHLLVYTNSQRVWRQNTKGTYYLYDAATRKLTPLSRRPGWQMFAKFSPDGKKVGFVRDNDLWLVDVASGAETRLTRGGSETIVNGTTDWVYEEELGLADAWRWSPDGKRIAFWRFDQGPVRVQYLVNELGDYTTPVPIRYPKAGTPNSRVRIGVLELAASRITWMDTGADTLGYLARMDFAESPTEITIQRLNRHQDRLDLLMGDVTTGRTRTLLTERDSAWVDIAEDPLWIGGGKQFLWTSERDGWNHVYLYGRDGKLVRQVTGGDFEISGIDGVDEKNGWLYFSAANPTPMERQLFRVGLDGQGMRRLSTERGTHNIEMSPDASAYLDQYSRAGVPPVYRLHRADGTLVRVLEDNARAAAAVRGAGMGEPERFTVTTRDGVTLNGWMIRPRDFDPARKYPVMMNVYGGPWSQSVVDEWGGSDYLWHELLAQRGYIVASFDNRGTPGRGHDFEKPVFLRLGQIEPRDQIDAARQLAALPYVDAGRIGMWGWSYGGYLTAMSLLQGGSLFKAGISVAPVSDWKLYDTIYTERYMHTPQENPDGYREASLLPRAAQLSSAFLLVHGTGDDNVHVQNSLQLANALEAAKKQFDLMLYPNRTHSIAGGTTRVHLYTLMTEWVVGHL
jgi:dipeptidyl-peptidase-4